MRTEKSDELIFQAFKVSAVSAAQVLIFVLLYEAAVEIYVAKVGSMNKIFGFDMQMSYALWLLSILAGVHALMHLLLKSVEHKLIVTISCTAVWIAYWGNIADDVPNRFGLLVVLGMLSFLSGALLSLRQRTFAWT